MARQGIKPKDISGLLEVTPKTLRSRMKGNSEFTRKDMFKIQELFFRDSTLEYLFKLDNPETSVPEKDT